MPRDQPSGLLLVEVEGWHRALPPEIAVRGCIQRRQPVAATGSLAGVPGWILDGECASQARERRREGGADRG
jgi:hypothetical protein